MSIAETLTLKKKRESFSLLRLGAQQVALPNILGEEEKKVVKQSISLNNLLIQCKLSIYEKRREKSILQKKAAIFGGRRRKKAEIKGRRTALPYIVSGSSISSLYTTASFQNAGCQCLTVPRLVVWGSGRIKSTPPRTQECPSPTTTTSSRGGFPHSLTVILTSPQAVAGSAACSSLLKTSNVSTAYPHQIAP